MSFFKLSNKNNVLVNLIGNKPKFVFESSALTYNINEIRRQINTELECRNFDVPGVDIVFSHSVDALGTHNITIFGIDCDKLDISTNSDSEVRIGGMSMCLYSDRSGSLDVYCGKDWATDRSEFINKYRHHHKLDGKSRTVLQYNYCGRFKIEFEATNDCGRSYFPDGSEDEPISYSLFAIETSIIFGLVEFLNYIKLFPVPKRKSDVFSQPKPIKLSNPLFYGAKLYTAVTTDDADRINNNDYSNYGKAGGWRLLDLGIQGPKDHPYVDCMNDGFIYCDIEFLDTDVTKNVWHYISNPQPASIELENADFVFVVDHAAAERFKDKWFETNPDEERMTDLAYTQMKVERANTMIHINDYVGGFEKPVVIISRIISTSEITILSNNTTDI